MCGGRGKGGGTCDVFGWLFVYLIIYFTLMPPCGGRKIVLCFSYSGRVNEL